ncbi:MAG: hypothetical protein JKX97_03110 [Candidatus Lindowbacteria bacterium]|nr:hypothetical protein [Candidatus Lindowbacteria bacterium]
MTRKKFALLILVLFLLNSCSTFPEPKLPEVSFASARIKEMRGRTLAVLPFNNASHFLGAERLVADEFNLRFGMTDEFIMVERIRVQELYREQDFHPERINDTSAAKIGKMLGANAVVLGTVTRYLHGNRPPDVPIDLFPVLIPIENENDAIVSAIVNSVLALVTLVSVTPPIVEVGVSVRIVDTQTGEILWQAVNSYRGDDEYLTKTHPRSEWDRLRDDVVFLTATLAADMVETLKLAMTEETWERSNGVEPDDL